MSGVNLLDKIKGKSKGAEAASSKKSFGRSSLNLALPKANIALFLKLLVAVGIFFGGQYLLRDYIKKQEDELKAEIAVIDKKVTKVKRQVREIRQFIRQAEYYTKQKKDLLRKLSLIEETSKKKNTIIRMVDYVINEMPEYVWLDQVNIEPTAKGVSIIGYARDFQNVSAFMKRLEGAVFFPHWSLVESKKDTFTPKVESAGSAEKIEAEARKFTLTATVVD